MRVLPTLLMVLILAACGSSRGVRAGTLSFAQMQSINPGVSATWLLAEYPFARDVQRHPTGAVARMQFVVTDPDNKSRTLTLFFDTQGVLTRKNYAGPFVRPPVDTDREGNPTNQ